MLRLKEFHLDLAMRIFYPYFITASELKLTSNSKIRTWDLASKIFDKYQTLRRCKYHRRIQSGFEIVQQFEIPNSYPKLMKTKNVEAPSSNHKVF